MVVSKRRADDPNKQPKIVVALGAPGVGKTVYLGALLDSLARGNDFHVTPDGSGTSHMQYRVMSALSQNTFPEICVETKWPWAQLLWGKGRKTTDVYVPDFPALSVIEDYEGRRVWPVISNTITRSAALMLFLDAAAIQRGDADEEYFALHLLRYYMDAFRLPIDDTDRPRKRKTRVAIVLTKTDQSEDCLEDPEGFVRGQLPELWKACKDQLRCYKCFATNVVGTCVSIDGQRGYKTEVPLRVEPRGLQDPLRWILQKI